MSRASRPPVSIPTVFNFSSSLCLVSFYLSFVIPHLCQFVPDDPLEEILLFAFWQLAFRLVNAHTRARAHARLN